ncbi:restriction endonuclease subunit S [Aeromonas veronii]|uniref:restriction endonuclease subunit S n=1 Tax=Aeromonas veronii TaxID=654 RepID=UPI002230FBD2|nr:restriction endonuclease subunit S [Aeromonas veronii]UZE59168.1 restriction endonuclease subunit S [Aeromonas veronii]
MQTRHDPYYYLPKFVRLEARVTARSTARLRDYVLALSGGSTPKKEEEEKYYADAESGIPFVRVQNLNVDGHLSLDDVKYVNRETHEGLLNRSKVFQDDLLVKITGVGRMAVASVPPIGFEGNVNQHIARIRTESRATSEALAAWLNTDIAETLAKRRSTGGTRPALDYPALRSIPVILDAQVQKELSEAYAQCKQAEAKANELLAGIDDYLLSELGIILPPEPENTIASRIFTAQRKELAGWRFDPLFHSFGLWHAIEESRIPTKKLGLCCHYLKTGFAAGGDMQLFDNSGVIQLRPTNIDTNRELVFGRNVYLDKSVLMDRPDDVIRPGEVLFNNTNSQELVGKTAYMDIDGESFVCSNHMTRIAVIEDELDAEYLTSLLNAYQRLKVFFSLCTNWNNQSGVNVDLLRQLPIPLPSKEKQMVIAGNIRAIRQEAKRLRQTAETELDAAKRQIEAILFGEETA